MACYETRHFGTVFTKREGTPRCSVKLRIRKEDFDFIRKFYGKENGVLRFATGEVYGQGYGWYVIWSREVPVFDHTGKCIGLRNDGALRVLANLEHALAQRAQGIQKWIDPRVHAESERKRVLAQRLLKEVAQRTKKHVMPVIALPIPATHNKKVICVVKNRALQIELNKPALVAASWRESKPVPPPPKPATPDQLKQLLNLFN
jgi:hypothetical protein